MKEARNSLLSTMLIFCINKGETFSLVGESGSGKTTIGRAIIGLNDTSNGEIIFDGKKINGHLSHSEKNRPYPSYSDDFSKTLQLV